MICVCLKVKFSFKSSFSRVSKYKKMKNDVCWIHTVLFNFRLEKGGRGGGVRRRVTMEIVS